MAEQTTHHATTEVPAGGGEHAEPSMVNVSGSMMALTWVTFAITAFVLYKAAWKPILAGLDKREESLRRALDDAEKTRKELANIEQNRARIIAEADNRSREIVDQARRAAVEAAHTIEEKARSEAQILLENARREIRAEQDKAMATLRRESAELAIDISRKILSENLDEEKSRIIADRVISRL
jgi:F-type H+-transporting ATPase subunit b